MNKLRLIKINELRGEIHPIEAYIIEYLEGMHKEERIDYNRYVKDNLYFIEHDLITKDILLFIPFNEFQQRFKCSLEEAKDIMGYLLGKHLNIDINQVIW